MIRAKTCIRLKAGTSFNQVARTPLIKFIKKLNCNVCQLDCLFALINDQTFIFQSRNEEHPLYSVFFFVPLESV